MTTNSVDKKLNDMANLCWQWKHYQGADFMPPLLRKALIELSHEVIAAAHMEEYIDYSRKIVNESRN